MYKEWTVISTDRLPDVFILYASDILADTKKGLNRAEIVKQFNKYAIKFGVDIPGPMSRFSTS